MTLLRRFLVLQFLMLWQGGFLFYAGVVVPIGTEVLGGKFQQGRITRFVTVQMNVIGAIALALFAWEILCTPASRSLKRVLAGSWLVMAIALTALFLLHPRMVEMVDVDNMAFIGSSADFHVLHRTYLWVSTFQWIAGLVFAFALVVSWRREANAKRTC